MLRPQPVRRWSGSAAEEGFDMPDLKDTKAMLDELA
jgi:hypothetical protein